jgi:hypothetical protein
MTNELVLKNEELVYKLRLSYTPYERRVLLLEFLNMGLLCTALFSEGVFGLLFSCREQAFCLSTDNNLVKSLNPIWEGTQ